MDAPKCRSCGKRHWGSVCLSAVDDVRGAVAERVAAKPVRKAPEPVRVAPVVDAPPVSVEPYVAASEGSDATTYRYRDPEARKAYMREYMRNRRKLLASARKGK